MFQLKQLLVVPVVDGEQSTSSAKFSPDGFKVAICQGIQILIFDVSNGNLIQTIHTSHIRPISDICWSPDGQCIAIASDDCAVEIIHVSLYGRLHRLVGHTAPVISVCYNSKSNLLFTSSMDESIKIWDTLNGTLMKTMSAHSDAVVSIDLPQDDSTILGSGSYDGLIRIFDTHTGNCLKTLTYDKDWKSETGVVAISQVKFSRNGKYLLVKSLDGIVKIWDCIRGDVVRTFTVPDVESAELIHSCGMDFMYPSENELDPLVISGNEKGNIYCWNVSSKHLLQSLNSQEYHGASPIISIDCHGNTMCSLSLNGKCCLWEWST